MSDRRVHGRTADGGEIVRYDRAGKWYIEYESRSLRPCRRVGVLEAARLASEVGASAVRGISGGTRFDAALRVASDEDGQR